MNVQRLVSVIIGTKDRPEPLREALASIRALEGPDLAFQILVGDNGDNPRTREVVEEFGGIYGKTGTPGCPAARNVAMAEAKGEFIAFLDDDDVWTPGHIRPHLALLDRRADLAAVIGRIQSTDPFLKPLGQPWPETAPEDGDLFRIMLAGYFPQVGGTVVRASVVREIGLMDESLIGDSDWDWQLRIAKDRRIGFVPVTCVLFRQRPPGSFDRLQINRVSYTRRIFWRHAWPERKRWPNGVAVARDYFRCVQGYYDYFVSAAHARLKLGDTRGARYAVACLFRIMPHRAAKAFLRDNELRKAVFSTRSISVTEMPDGARRDG